jgi:hypothetical protein
VTVTLTSQVLGKQPGDTYTGTLEDWLCAEGYARKAGYTGPGVSNTGPTDVVPAKDPGLPANRGDKPYFPLTPDEDTTIANDADNLNEESHPHKAFDFDQGGVDEDPTTPAADGDADGDASTPA